MKTLKDYTARELWARKIRVTRDGEVVSEGVFTFMNYDLSGPALGPTQRVVGLGADGYAIRMLYQNYKLYLPNDEVEFLD